MSIVLIYTNCLLTNIMYTPRSPANTIYTTENTDLYSLSVL